MNGAYGVGLQAFDRLGDMLIKSCWIAACVAGVLVVLCVVQEWGKA